MIEIHQLSKVYKVYNPRSLRIKEWLTLGKVKKHEEFWALKNISLNIQPGRVFGIVGMNGAGKSTLLKILTGTSTQTSGSFKMNGTVSALLELGAGFHPEMTGEENVVTNGRIIGLSRDELMDKMEEIKEFSELGDFFFKPVRTYSSGMYVRLAFSLASATRPKILIIDEALSVGDAYFQQKCLRRIQEFKESGVTILFVSHDAGAVKLLCDEVGLLDEGQLISTGDPQEMMELYNAMLSKVGEGGKEYIINRARTTEPMRSGNLKAQIKKIILKASGKGVTAIETGSPVDLEIHVQFNEAIANPTVGIMIRDRLGYDIFGTNTFEVLESTGSHGKNSQTIFRFSFPLNIGPGDYTVTAAVHSSRTHLEECYEWADRLLTFKVLPKSDYHFLGVSLIKPDIRVEQI